MRPMVGLLGLLCSVIANAQVIDTSVPLPIAPDAARDIHDAGERYALVGAWDADPWAMSFMLRYETYAGFRGPAIAEHQHALLSLLRRFGDTRFADALRGEAPLVHLNVLTALRRAAGSDSSRLAARYPLTFGPRVPGEPSVEECAMRERAHQPTPARLLPGAAPIGPLPSAPKPLAMMVQVDAAGVPELYTMGLPAHSDSATWAAVKAAVSRWRFAPAQIDGCGIPYLYQAVLQP